MGRSSYRYGAPDAPHFLTATTVAWLPLFTKPEIVDILLECWHHQQIHMGLRLHGWVIMRDHIHRLASSDDLPKTVHSFKTYTAGRIVKYLKSQQDEKALELLTLHKKAHKKDRTHQVWQEGSHPVMIQSEDMMRQRLEYIHFNPVRSGYVEEPEEWACSSASDYCDKPGLLRIDKYWF